MMPLSAKRRCKCGEVVRGQCAACSKEWNRTTDERRQGTEHRQLAQKVYSSRRFKSLRKQVYQRDAATCAMCGELVQWQEYHCDHKVPLQERPDLAFEESNLQVMHAGCHAQKTRQGG